MFIAGNWEEAAGGGRFEVTNPADGDVLADVADGGGQDAARAIDAAADAFPSWAGATVYDRSRALFKAWQIMMERKEELAVTMTREQGKPIRAARNSCVRTRTLFSARETSCCVWITVI